MLKVFNHLYRSVVKPLFTCGRFLDSLQPQQLRRHSPKNWLENKNDRGPVKSAWMDAEGLVIQERKVLKAHGLGKKKKLKIRACLQIGTENGCVGDRDCGRKEGREEKYALCDSKWFCPKWNIQKIDITSARSHLRSRFTVISQQLDAVTQKY